MGWFKNTASKVADWVKNAYETITNNQQQIQTVNNKVLEDQLKLFGFNADAKYAYDNSNESPLDPRNDPLAKEKARIEAEIEALKSAYPQSPSSSTVNTGEPKGEDPKDDKEEAIDYSKIIAAIQKGMDASSQYAKNQYENQLAAIEEQRKYAEELAQKAREDALKNAYVNYDRSLSTYGQNAERLAQIGLSNSGYSDYLNGVAYSSMVGGVQDANKTANEAIQKAYYNASQQKAEAADTYYNRAADAQNAYQDRLVSLLGAAGSGEIDANTAKNIAAAYGMDEGVISVIGDVAKTNYEKTVEAQKTDLYNTYLTNISSETTDDEIASWEISDIDTVNKLKTARNDMLASNLVESLKNGDGAETDKLVSVEEAKLSKKISDDKYQECYFYNALNLIDCVTGGTITAEKAEESLQRWKNGGQLNEVDYNSLLKYLEDKTKIKMSAEKVKSKAGFGNIALATLIDGLAAVAGGLMIGGTGGAGTPYAAALIFSAHALTEKLWDNRRNVTINGNKYTVDVVDDYSFTSEEKELLNNVAGDDTIIRAGDEYYVKHSRTGEWAKVKKEGTDEEFFNAFNSKAMTPEVLTRPQHFTQK